VKGIAMAAFGNMDDSRDIEIRFRKFGFADAVCLVGKRVVQAAFIDFGIDGHRTNAHAPCCADNADGYFATVGYEEFFYHVGCWMLGLLFKVLFCRFD
jgi:hypothetical protein